jgi:ParB-like chromosome segregation protein Spo0J
MLISTDTLKPHPLNPQIYGESQIDPNLCKDIQEKGILSPIVVNPDHTIISGHSRWLIARKLGLNTVPVEVRTFGTEEEENLALISYNKTRIKTYDQEMREIDAERKLRAQLNLPMTFEVLVDSLNMSKGSFHRKNFVWQAAQQGDEKAQKLVARIKADPRYTPTKAYNDLLAHRNLEKVKLARKEAAQLGQILDQVGNLYAGDFSEVLSFIPDGTVDAIITDPPYPFEFINCWSKLGEFAKQKLRPGGWLVAYSGQKHLPEVFARLQGSGLKYYWTMALYHNGTRQDVWGVDLNVMWKPILVYVQPPIMKLDSGGCPDYIVSPQQEKQEHSWQQSESSVKQLIEIFTKPGDFVVDPFVGSGTTLVAAMELDRKTLGSEIDMDAYNIAKTRLSNTYNLTHLD